MTPDERLSKMEQHLAVISTNTDRLIKSMDGNGQPGLIARVAVIEEKMNNLPTNTKSNVAAGGGIAAIILALVAALLNHFGVNF